MKPKQLNIFGELEDIELSAPPAANKTRKDKFEDYEAFVAKFDKDAPKTTDDCCTPQAVYDAVLEWLGERVNLKGRPIVRPFYPGGDYVNYEYPENCVVVDNPPFSIVSKICRFYQANEIDYFLFAPGLTLFSSGIKGNCDVIIKSPIKYHNGADVATGFKTNLFNNLSVMIASSLSDMIDEAQGIHRLKKPKMPFNIISSALLRKVVSDADIGLSTDKMVYVRTLDAGVAVFGTGYFVPTKIAERLWGEKRNDEGRYPFSVREEEIIRKLDDEYEEENETS